MRTHRTSRRSVEIIQRPTKLLHAVIHRLASLSLLDIRILGFVVLSSRHLILQFLHLPAQSRELPLHALVFPVTQIPDLLPAIVMLLPAPVLTPVRLALNRYTIGEVHIARVHCSPEEMSAGVVCINALSIDIRVGPIIFLPLGSCADSLCLLWVSNRPRCRMGQPRA